MSFKGGKDARMALSASSGFGSASDFQMISSRHGGSEARMALNQMREAAPSIREDEPLAEAMEKGEMNGNGVSHAS